MLAPIPVDTPALAVLAIIPQGLPSAPEHIAAPQDGQSSVTMLAPIPIDTPALAVLAIGNRDMSTTTHAPVMVPPASNTAENAGPSASTSNALQQISKNAIIFHSVLMLHEHNDIPALIQKWFTHMEKMCLGYRCTARCVR